jgi:hypothetical protein
MQNLSCWDVLHGLILADTPTSWSFHLHQAFA